MSRSQSLADIIGNSLDWDDRTKPGRLLGADEAERELVSMGRGSDFTALNRAMVKLIGAGRMPPVMRSSRAATPEGVQPLVFTVKHVSKPRSAKPVSKPGRVYFSVDRQDRQKAINSGLKRDRASGMMWAESGSPVATAWQADGHQPMPHVIGRSSVNARAKGTASAHIRYIRRSGATETHVTSDGEVLESVASNIANKISDQTRFFQILESPKSEGGTEQEAGRIQSRIIAELPYEVSPSDRYEIVRSFVELFEERNLPYVAAIHKPDSHGDARNYHVHIAFHDRPFRPVSGSSINSRSASENGSGGRQVRSGGSSVTIARSAGSTTNTRQDTARRNLPWEWARKKDRDLVSKTWLIEMREKFADAANRVLARTESPRRFDPGSYQKLGIEKTPHVHMGPVVAALERKGFLTFEGLHNLRSERAFEKKMVHETSGGLTANRDAGNTLVNLAEASRDLELARSYLHGQREHTVGADSEFLADDVAVRVEGRVVELRDRAGSVERARRLHQQREAPSLSRLAQAWIESDLQGPDRMQGEEDLDLLPSAGKAKPVPDTRRGPWPDPVEAAQAKVVRAWELVLLASRERVAAWSRGMERDEWEVQLKASETRLTDLDGRYEDAVAGVFEEVRNTGSTRSKALGRIDEIEHLAMQQETDTETPVYSDRREPTPFSAGERFLFETVNQRQRERETLGFLRDLDREFLVFDDPEELRRRRTKIDEAQEDERVALERLLTQPKAVNHVMTEAVRRELLALHTRREMRVKQRSGKTSLYKAPEL